MVNNIEERKDCPMRHESGNCLVIGGFCVNAVSDEICHALHKAHEKGLRDGVEKMKEQEAVEPFHKCIGNEFSRIASELIEDAHYDYCPYCGKPITWEGR